MDRADSELAIPVQLQQRMRTTVTRNAFSALFRSFINSIEALGRLFFGRVDAIDVERRRIEQDHVLDDLCRIEGTLKSGRSGKVEPSLRQANTVPEPPSGSSGQRLISFSGRDWIVKGSSDQLGPGPNYFCADQTNVWTDDRGQLHLTIRRDGDKWLCSEVISSEVFGFGRYVWFLASRVDHLDPNVVLGLFTWNDEAPAENYRELDIEVARWGLLDAQAGNFAVQPAQRVGNLDRFDLSLNGLYSTHVIDWTAGAICFESIHGHYSESAGQPQVLRRWEYHGADAPGEGSQGVRMNLWLNQGRSPSNAQAAEVTITRFEFHPHVPGG